MYNLDYVILTSATDEELSSKITGGQPTGGNTNANTTANTEGTTVAPNATYDETPMGAGAMFATMLPMLLMVAIMYFIVIRPQRKQAKEMKTMQDAIRVGDNVVTSSGFFGKIVSVGEDAFVVEFGENRGVRIPVAKADILAIKSPKLTPPPVAVVPKE